MKRTFCVWIIQINKPGVKTDAWLIATNPKRTRTKFIVFLNDPSDHSTFCYMSQSKNHLFMVIKNLCRLISIFALNPVVRCTKNQNSLERYAMTWLIENPSIRSLVHCELRYSRTLLGHDEVITSMSKQIKQTPKMTGTSDNLFCIWYNSDITV